MSNLPDGWATAGYVRRVATSRSELQAADRAESA
jgi:hypothetical protein